MTPSPRPAISKTPLALAGLLSTVVISILPNVAHAHHSMDGETPATLVQGLLSGLAHPVIGLDHLAMLLLVGVYCGTRRHGVGPVVSFVVAGLLGCLAHAGRLDLPHVETGIAASLLILGIATSALSGASRAVTAVVFGAAGVLHGYAHGEAIVGAEPTPLVAYLVGLSLVQLAVAGVLTYAVEPRQDRPRTVLSSRVTLVQLTGIASALVGAVALAF
jgi:urease accessory protein